MKLILLLLSIGFLTVSAQEILKIKSFDNEVIEGRLNVPAAGFKNVIVIDVPSSGPMTYENMRKLGRNTVFKYNDYFMDEFARRGIAYFSYSTRYTQIDTTNPPNYDKVDKEKFFAYTPEVKVKDLEEVIKFIKNNGITKQCRIILLGFSEGALLASIVAERKLAQVDALFLAGTPTEDVYSTILWQMSGQASMINYRKMLDANKDNIIQKSEYETADPRAIARLGGKKFNELDVNADSVLTKDDFRLMLQPYLEQILSAVEKEDNEWIWNSFFRVGAKWIKEHRTLEPNKTRLLRLDIPVYIFHGTYDANCPVEGIVDLQKKAEELNRKNIHVYIIPESDHSLEFISWVVKKQLPEGLKMMFDEAEKF